MIIIYTNNAYIKIKQNGTHDKFPHLHPNMPHSSKMDAMATLTRRFPDAQIPRVSAD